ncbi:MAG: 3'-5' exonuclease, partial [Terracidiphilus sp.]
KGRLLELIASLGKIPNLESALAAVRRLPPPRYTEEDWRIVRACFLLLRRAAAELQVVFAESAAADYIEVAQIAESVLKGESEIPNESALAVADGVRHLLVDEFQDTSRRQHRLLGWLIAAWSEREGRTCFVVGDPMQSIYFFRDADAELFPRVAIAGLEIPNDLPLNFDFVKLFANFRTARPLVKQLNDAFTKVFEENDGSGVTFSNAEPARDERSRHELSIAGAQSAPLELHVEFIPQTKPGNSRSPDAALEKKRIAAERKAGQEKQTAELVDVIRAHLAKSEQTCAPGAKYRTAVLGRTRSTLVRVAEALRAASIPFCAVELESLKQRPEVLDALALARALLNPQDRVAWLGVLRAPWCGLSLEDLHKLASADDAELLNKPVPDLLADRRQLLSEEGRAGVERVLRAVESVPGLRLAQPASTPGTWLEQVWLRLGGGQCVDAAGRANVDLLWRALDGLPEGEQDLLGPALDAALEKLTALPDPNANSDCGVQLMTIHKSKGLEFEVVIVPDLQARAAHTRGKLLSWLERGLPEPDDSGEPTEFLVAPLQSRGADRGKAKEWVDRVYRERETQEMRRLLYVAATRAREELHLFARPSYAIGKDGSFNLLEPRESLLATAWSAMKDEIGKQFEAWRDRVEMQEAEPAVIESIAAAGESVLFAEPAQERGTLLRRLHTDIEIAQNASPAANVEPAIVGGGELYERHEGGLLSRALGVAVHTLLEALARLLPSQDWDEARAALARMEPSVAAQVRGAGIERAQAGRIAARALEIALKASRDPVGQWILSPHAGAESEVRWAGVVAGNLRTVQVDRVFRGGAEPRADSGAVWWAIDYKTAHEGEPDAATVLPRFRKIFAPQIESYARVLRNLHGADAAVRGGLYYPLMLKFDWWEI